jgi:hypothetical protein
MQKSRLLLDVLKVAGCDAVVAKGSQNALEGIEPAPMFLGQLLRQNRSILIEGSSECRRAWELSASGVSPDFSHGKRHRAWAQGNHGYFPRPVQEAIVENVHYSYDRRVRIAYFEPELRQHRLGADMAIDAPPVHVAITQATAPMALARGQSLTLEVPAFADFKKEWTLKCSNEHVNFSLIPRYDYPEDQWRFAVSTHDPRLKVGDALKVTCALVDKDTKAVEATREIVFTIVPPEQTRA